MSSAGSGLEVTGLTHRGQGVVRMDGRVVFVPGAVPGDLVELRITERRSNYSVGEISRLVQPSPWRAEPRCSVFSACGGCTFQNFSYPAQLEWKRAQVHEALRRIGQLEGLVVHPALPSPRLWGYRNKSSFPLGKAGSRVIAGCFAPGTHRIVDTAECPVQHPLNNLILRQARELIAAMGLSVYREQTRRGLVRHLVTRVGVGTGEGMAILVTGTRSFPAGSQFGEGLLSQTPGLVSVVQNVNAEPTNIVLGNETRILAGKGHVDDIMGDDVLGRLRFRVSPLSFYQVNPEQAVNLYRVVLQYAGLTGSETVVDVYSGVGTIALFLANQAGAVVGIDEVGAAVADARVNAGLNGIDNAEFITGRAERVLPQLAGRGLRADVVVLDPPRAGCAPEVLQACARLSPARLVYVSCYPATLARDLARLCGLGYRVWEVQPVDMFPMTPHVETIVLMSRAKE